MTDGPLARMIRRVSPPWLQRTRGGAIMGAFGDVLDDVLDLSGQSIRKRFPGDWQDTFPLPLPFLASDELAPIGRDRRIPRGPDERDDVYAARLRRWLEDHQRRGGALALLGQLAAFWSVAPKRVSLRYPSGVWWTLDTDGTITRSIHPTNADLTRWARLTVVYELPSDPTPISFADFTAFTQIPREWNAAHVLLSVAATWPGAEMWCDDGLWEDDGTLWGGGVVVSDLF